MSSPCHPDDVKEVLWASLADSSVDLDELKQKISAGTQLTELGLDSLDGLDYYLRLQDTFDLDIPAEDFSQLNSFADIAAYINSKKGLQ